MPKSTWTQDDFYMMYRTYRRDFPTWRIGQCMFVALETYDPELAAMIRGTQYDPFYADGRDPRIEAFEKELWG